MAIVRPAKTAVRLPELEKNGEGGQNAGKQSGSGEAGLQQARSRCPEARMPWGDNKARHMVEVPGTTIDAHRLHRGVNRRKSWDICLVPAPDQTTG